ncbi:MAG: MFS transporter [Hyphomonadaceae bacterium]|nr:MFS transporter [Hyphomonadaceae bacterium]
MKAGDTQAPAPPHKPVSIIYSWYIVAVLMLAYLLSYVDRSILSLLVGPIRADLSLSDTQLSLLHGFAFALFYATLGFPLGRMADNRNRKNIITGGISVWSLFTAACGLANNFWQLFLTRMGVGVGEAALNPSAYSIISDRFPKHLLARALSTYVMGTYMGFGMAFVVGGLVVQAVTATPTMEIPVLGEVYTWQLAFFYVGFPGLLVALLVYLTVREPARKGLAAGVHDGKAVPIRDVIRFVFLNRRTFICHLAGFSLTGILVNGLVLWTPSFFQRTYGMPVTEAGVTYGLILLVFGPLGIFSGGVVSDWIDRKGPAGGSFKTAAGFVALAITPAILSPLMPTATLAFVFIAVLVFASSAPWGVAVSAIQQITPNEMRGQVSALYLFVVNLIGIGFGPTIVALLTDRVFNDDALLRYSMVSVGAGAAILASFILFLGVGAFRRSAQHAATWSD